MMPQNNDGAAEQRVHVGVFTLAHDVPVHEAEQTAALLQRGLRITEALRLARQQIIADRVWRFLTGEEDIV